jgi:2-dehydro-3-deoxyphosphogluconate aldolase/(4S)-4-hydroxy-2-oxoglutarate aldolase
MPTGGVTLANLAEHIAAGAAAVGVGSELVNVEELARGDSASLRDRARAYAAAVRDARVELTAASKTQPLYQGA